MQIKLMMYELGGKVERGQFNVVN